MRPDAAISQYGKRLWRFFGFIRAPTNRFDQSCRNDPNDHSERYSFRSRNNWRSGCNSRACGASRSARVSDDACAAGPIFGEPTTVICRIGVMNELRRTVGATGGFGRRQKTLKTAFIRERITRRETQILATFVWTEPSTNAVQ